MELVLCRGNVLKGVLCYVWTLCEGFFVRRSMSRYIVRVHAVFFLRTRLTCVYYLRSKHDYVILQSCMRLKDVFVFSTPARSRRITRAPYFHDLTYLQCEVHPRIVHPRTFVLEPVHTWSVPCCASWCATAQPHARSFDPTVNIIFLQATFVPDTREDINPSSHKLSTTPVRLPARIIIAPILSHPHAQLLSTQLTLALLAHLHSETCRDA